MKSWHLGAELLPRATSGVSADAQVRELEGLIGATLPDEYRQFLTQWGGALIPGSVLFPGSGEPPFGNEAILDVLFGLLPGNGYDIADNLRGFEGQLPADLLPVA